MIINDNNERSEKQGKNTQDYLQKQLDMIMEQKKSKEEQYKETLAFLTTKYEEKKSGQFYLLLLSGQVDLLMVCLNFLFIKI